MNILVTALIRILEAMFLLGMVGSAAVVLETTIEDARIMFERETPAAVSNVDTESGGV